MSEFSHVSDHDYSIIMLHSKEPTQMLEAIIAELIASHRDLRQRNAESDAYSLDPTKGTESDRLAYDRREKRGFAISHLLTQLVMQAPVIIEIWQREYERQERVTEQAAVMQDNLHL